MEHEPRQDDPAWDPTDDVLKAAFQDVPVPAGLSARILDRLAAARRDLPPGDPAAKTSGTAPLAAAHSLAPLERKLAGARSRRRVLAAIGAFATVASVAAVAVLLGHHRTHLDSPSSILEQSVRFFAAEGAAPGRLLAKESPPEKYPFSRDVVRGSKVRWREVERFLGGPAVAYDLGEAGGPRATLYVAQRLSAGLPAFPPAAPLWNTAGCCAAVWQTQNVLYVLVVEGDLRTYRDCLDVSGSPVT